MSFLGKLFGRREAAWIWITPAQLQEQLAQSAKPRLVDVRGPEEFRGPDGHVPGAENQPMPKLLAQPGVLLKEQRPIVLICLSQIRSAKVADALAGAGVKRLAVVRGGMQAWRAAGLPVQY